MKAAMFRTDNSGAVVGHLSAPDRMQYENEGHIGTFDLSGNIVETEYYDVLAVGERDEDGHFKVQRMESLPTAEDGILKFSIAGESGKAYCMAIPKSQVISVEERFSKTNTKYHCMHVRTGKNASMYVNVLGAFDQTPSTDVYVFLLKEAPKRDRQEFGSGYAVKTVTTDYATGVQLKS